MDQNLQKYLMNKFQVWKPQAPEVVERTKRSVTLKWLESEPFGFMRNYLIYKVQRKEKTPQWVTVYSGGKTIKTIENLAPSHPHKFRIQVILKSTAVSSLTQEAVKHYSDEETIYSIMENIRRCDEVSLTDRARLSDQHSKESVNEINETLMDLDKIIKSDAVSSSEEIPDVNNILKDYKKDPTCLKNIHERTKGLGPSHEWLESQWSEETWTSTDTDGTSAMCFCVAVRCGYFKQVQVMLEERPILIGAINSNTGLTPLATAVKKGLPLLLLFLPYKSFLASFSLQVMAGCKIYRGDLNAVKFILSLGAEVDQPTTASQTPLHLAVLAGHVAIADVLLEKGANFQARDFNGLRVEHYAIDSCDLDMIKHIMDKGGDIEVKDCNGWTPLFRAVCQGAKTEVIEELMQRGSSVDVTDRRGLTLVAAARLLRNRQGRCRDSVLRLVDSQFPHEKALANFTRLTKKIYSVHSLLK